MLSPIPAARNLLGLEAPRYRCRSAYAPRCAPAGVRVINVFPGPIDDEWNQGLPPPKLTPDALAKAVVNALKDGVEDIYPGDVAQEWLRDGKRVRKYSSEKSPFIEQEPVCQAPGREK